MPFFLFAALASIAWISGCAQTAYVHYAGTAHTHPVLSGRPTIAISKFEDARKIKHKIGSFGMGTYDLEASVDFGRAMQEQIAWVLHDAGYNVLLIEENATDLNALLNRNKADLAMGGVIRHFSLNIPDALTSPTVQGFVEVATLKPGEQSSQKTEVVVNAKEPTAKLGWASIGNNWKLMFGNGRHPGLDDSFARSVRRIAASAVQDSQIARRLPEKSAATTSDLTVHTQ